MRLHEITNAPNMLLYHFTNGEYLRQIIESNRIEAYPAHGLDDEGISLTRDRNLNLLKTYAIAGHKPFRIGLSYQKLRYKHKLIPIRDIQFYKSHKAKQFYSNYFSNINLHPTYTDNNESEEFLLGDIYPLTDYWVELAIDSIFTEQVADDEDDQYQNMQTYWDIYAGTYGKKFGQVHRPIKIPKTVKFLEIDHDNPHPKTDMEPIYNRSSRNPVKQSKTYSTQQDDWTQSDQSSHGIKV